jgi:hypothetical protein
LIWKETGMLMVDNRACKTGAAAGGGAGAGVFRVLELVQACSHRPSTSEKNKR